MARLVQLQSAARGKSRPVLPCVLFTYTTSVIVREEGRMAHAHQVFVYGTLKGGQPNHGLLSESSEEFIFIGQGRTVIKFPLVIASIYNIPYLLDIEGEGHNVVGEVYAVNDVMLAKLDELEGYPGYYNRRPINIQLEKSADGGESSDVLQCMVYILTNYKPAMRELETYDNYDSFGSHGKKYVSRYERGEGWPKTLYHSVLNHIHEDLKKVLGIC